MPIIDSEYEKARKQGEKAYKNALARGEYPYLPALDSFLNTKDVQTEVELGLVDIPLDQIAGTKTAGRQNAFACNFMPLIPIKSEFALKWDALFRYQLEEGVKDPIIAYEFMNRYYVLEGNKRVSVFKYLGAYSIEGYVTRIVPKLTEDPQVRVFYEYMEFYRRTAINYIRFTRPGSYAALVRECGMEPDHIWTEEERADFSSLYLRFQKLFEEKGGKKLSISCGDALLFMLRLHPYPEMKHMTAAQIKSSLDKIWKEFAVLQETPEESLVLDPGEGSGEANLFLRFFAGTGSRQLNIAFIHEKPASESSWVYAHELGRMHLEQVFGSKVRTTPYFILSEPDSGESVIDEAIADGNHIVFTTGERMLDASLKMALKHPSVKILNCSVNRPLSTIRTYYGRMYEAKFLAGMIGGAMAENNRIAYAAAYPIYGSLAEINAFALGAAMTNPRARVYLHWNCETGSSLDELIREHDISIVSDTDMMRPGTQSRRFGLYQLRDGRYQNLAAPIWNWGIFYEKIIRDIVSGSWKNEKKSRKALNYWWGISGGIIDLITSNRLPEGLAKLTQIIRREMYQDMYHPFERVITRQDGTKIGSPEKDLDAEEIITMNWLCDSVIGALPSPETMNEQARKLVEVHGVIPIRKEVLTVPVRPTLVT